MKVNIEVNHATLSGHDFHHEVAAAFANGIFGSIDANAGDDRLGWDLDRFPVSVEQMSLGMLEILRGGGFTTGGLNFDSKLRRQSIDRNDLFHAHIGGIDTMAHALVVAADILDDRHARCPPRGALQRMVGRTRPVDHRRQAHAGVTPRARPGRRPEDRPARAASRNSSRTSSRNTSTSPAETPGVRHRSFQVEPGPTIREPDVAAFGERGVGGLPRSDIGGRSSGRSPKRSSRSARRGPPSSTSATRHTVRPPAIDRRSAIPALGDAVRRHRSPATRPTASSTSSARRRRSRHRSSPRRLPSLGRSVTTNSRNRSTSPSNGWSSGLVESQSGRCRRPR